MKTIVGYFDNYEKAVAMVRELGARSFEPEAIQIGRAAKENGIKGESGGFSDNSVRGYYSAVARQESAFVAVAVSDNDSTGVCHIMGHHGAFCVEEWPAGRQNLF